RCPRRARMPTARRRSGTFGPSSVSLLRDARRRPFPGSVSVVAPLLRARCSLRGKRASTHPVWRGGADRALVREAPIVLAPRSLPLLPRAAPPSHLLRRGRDDADRLVVSDSLTAWHSVVNPVGPSQRVTPIPGRRTTQADGSVSPRPVGAR